VLLCGHIGALESLKLGYNGPLSRRLRPAATRARKLPDGADARALRRN
jgi:hypothetical protein